MVELNVSMKSSVSDLNNSVNEETNRLRKVVESKGGSMYAGSSLLRDVSDVIPARYRTTSLSENCAKGFLDI